MLFVLAEKPQAAEKLAAPFPYKKRDGYFEVNPCETFPRGAYIGYCVGHLLELYQPGDYQVEWKRWELKTLPIVPDTFKKRVIQGKSKLVKTIDNLIKKPEVKEVCIATDPAREGSNIGWEVLFHLNVNKPVKRLWISSLTESAVKRGFKQLREGKQDILNHYEAHARAVSDWLIGMNLSRALSLHLQQYGFNEAFPVGRVMTPVLKIIVDRELKIRNFQSSDFWELNAKFTAGEKEYEGTWFNNHTDRFLYEDDGQKLIGYLNDADGTVIEQINERQMVRPPQLFSLSSLQTDANKKFSYSPGQTLEIAQKLYTAEYISYPRTDSQYLSLEEAKQFPHIFKQLESLTDVQKYFPLPRVDISDDKRFVNEKLVSDHHAIIMTDKVPDIDALTEEERNIYLLITLRVVSAHYEDAQIDKAKIITEVNHEKFKTSGSQEVFPGWKTVLMPEGSKSEEKKPFLPLLEKNQSVQVDSLNLNKRKTKPPKKFTEGNLVNVLKYVGRYMEGNDPDNIDEDSKDDELGTVSLGTEATRAGIIDKLKDQKLIKVEKNVVTATEKGCTLIEALGSKTLLCSPLLTARWEKALRDIGKGKFRHESFIEKSILLTDSLLKDLQDSSAGWDFKEDVIGPGGEMAASLGACLKCSQSNVFRREDAYVCDSYPRQCSFRLSRKLSGKDISERQVRNLLSSGQTNQLKGFISKGGKPFDAYLYWDKQEERIKFGFINQRQEN